MNKSDLVKIILKKNDKYKFSEIEKIVDLFFKEITTALTNKKRVEIRGFGSFSVRNRPSRMARNPKNGEAVIIPSKFYPYFRPSKALKAGLNKQ